ncbi:MAG: hypothetical protein AAFX52_04375 [Pseudomonadota bacterium]
MKKVLFVVAATLGLAVGARALAHTGDAGHFISAHVAIPVALAITGVLAFVALTRRSKKNRR